MARPSCSGVNSISSSPIPLIGLYVAGATLVCLLLMLYDIIFSFRRKIRYLPCKLFSINSATLTLLAIASKLPVDLTTNMPRVSDQLSKLTGTTVVCTSMCFLMLSLGINGENESITNMIALSLFVITIVVNICIQIHAGVIFLFIVEHIIVLCCMLMLLSVMWAYTFSINHQRDALVESIRNIFKRGEASSLLHQVKVWYMSVCIGNPQHVLRGGDYGLSLLMICFICLAVASQAALRSLFHKLEMCEGVSDYGWSIPTILVTQIITIVVASLASAFRWITMVSDPPLYIHDFDLQTYFDVEIFSFQSLAKKRELHKVSIMFLFYALLKVTIVAAAVSIFWVLGAPLYVIRAVYLKTMRIFSAYCPTSFTRCSPAVVLGEWKKELTDVFLGTDEFPEWMMKICVKDMNKLTDQSNKSPPNYLVRLLSRPPTHPPQMLLHKMQQIGVAKGYYRSSSLTLVVLARIITLSMPSSLAQPIIQAMEEGFEIIYYIDKKTSIRKSHDQGTRRFAKVLLAYKNVHTSEVDTVRSMSEVVSSFENEYLAFPDGFAKSEMKIIRNFIRDQEYASIEELYEHLEQLFVDLLHFFLRQLPIVISKEVHESPIVVHEERARFVLECLCKLKLLEDKVEWLFPDGCQVTRLTDSEIGGDQRI